MKQEEIQTSFNAKFKMKVTAIEDAHFYRASLDVKGIENALKEMEIYAPTIKRTRIMHEVCKKNPPILYELEGYFYQDAMWTQESYKEDGEICTETYVDVPTEYDGATSIEFNGLRIELEFIEFEENDETKGCAPF